MDQQMGLVTYGVGIKQEGNRVVFGAPVPVAGKAGE
jgi:hypothetical protein